MSRELLRVDRFLLPLDPPGPGRYLLDALWAPHGARERLLRPFRRLPGGGRRLLRRLGEVPKESWRRELGSVERALADLGHPRADALLLLRGYTHDRRQRLTAFLFDEGAETPSAVLKLEPEAADGDSPLDREAGALEELAERLPPELAPTVPLLIGRGSSGGRRALLVAALPGRPAYVELRSALRVAGSPATVRRTARHLEAAAAWLARFQRAVARPGETWVPPTAQALGLSSPPPGWYRELTGLLEDHPLPVVSVHGDYWARNVLLGDGPGVGVCGVVDWEGYRSAGPLFEDLFHYPLTYGLALAQRRRGSVLRAFRRTFCGSGSPARAVAAYGRRWAADAGVDPRLLLPLFRLFLRRRALRSVWDPGVEVSGTGGRGRRLPWGRFEVIVERAARRDVAVEERCVFSG